jgi:demethylmenaquinone methyltransferase/2-methoxy-6-polyprenyl-1,4-benzoquinol methylase
MTPAPTRQDPAEPGVLRVFNTREQTKRYYDKIAKIYDLMADHSEAPARQAGLDLLAAQPGEKVLEVGFGTGHCLANLARAVGPSGKVYGIDIAQGMVDVARENLQKAGLLDAIFMSFTLELFDTPELAPFLAECKRVLRPGGRVGVVGMSKEGKHGAVFHLYEWTHEHFPNFVDCRPIFVARALEEAGFRVTKKEDREIWVPVEVVVAVKDS